MKPQKTSQSLSPSYKAAVEALFEALSLLDIHSDRAIHELTEQFRAILPLLPATFTPSIEPCVDITRQMSASDDPGERQRLFEELAAASNRVHEMLDQDPMDSSGDAKGNAALASQSIVLPQGIDEALFRSYLDAQDTAAAEIERNILNYERNRDEEHLSQIRRIIHTMKGESGVCGATVIEAACHAIEDAIPEGQPIDNDLLFAFHDWIQRAITDYARGVIPEPFACNRFAECREISEEQHAAPMPKGTADITDPNTPTEAPTPGSPQDITPNMDPMAAANAASIEADRFSELLGDWSIEDMELAGEFVEEAAEHFAAADENLIILEQEPEDKEAVAAVFRVFHTIKGVSGFVGLTPIGELAHAAETLLDDVRKDRRTFSGDVVDITFQSLDQLKSLFEILRRAIEGGKPFRVGAGYRENMINLQKVLNHEAPNLHGKVEGNANPTPAPASSTEPDSVPDPDPDPDPIPDKNRAKPETPSSPDPTEPQSRRRERLRSTVKVDAEKIDLLLDTIGELVIAESILAQNDEIRKLQSQSLEHSLSHLGKIARQLQNAGMAMRLVPIESTFQKMARLVRDLGKKSGKQVELTMEGQETEIDRGVVEKIGDPLVHMIRNSVDHGIESDTALRRQRGKPDKGRIHLRAFHKGGSVHIVIEDDGNGLDRDRITAKAIERGLIDNASILSDQEVYSLIFAPGFSTAATVSEISGRGVGMDVVKRNIESLRGNIVIESSPGNGSRFTIVLPLTMAIIDGMHVRVGREIYIIPTLSVIEAVKPEAGMISSLTRSSRMIRFRGNMLPLFFLSEIFNVPDAACKIEDITVVVVEDTEKHIALVVDELLGQNQTVIKSISHALGSLPGISGACIMSDGRPGLILDIAGILKIQTGRTSPTIAA